MVGIQIFDASKIDAAVFNSDFDNIAQHVTFYGVSVASVTL